MEDVKSLKIGIIGAGALGGSIALALSSLGYEIPLIFSRSQSSADYLSSKLKGSKSANSYQDISDECSVIFITTPDKNIKEISDLILWKSNQIVIHCSGVSDLNVLLSLKNSLGICSLNIGMLNLFVYFVSMFSFK